MIRPLAAMATFVKGLFKRQPKARTYEAPAAPTRDAPRAPHLRGNGKQSRALRVLRRQIIARSFTRFLARRPIGAAALGPQGAAWRKGLAGWRKGWASARANSATVLRAS